MRIPRHRSSGPTAFSLFVLAVSLLTNGCTTTPPQPYSMQDPQANFATFKTFAWDEGQAAETPGEPVTIVNGQIRTAIAGELQQKGYAEAMAGSKPDLLLRYETGAAEKLKSNPFRIGIGMGGAGSNGAAGVGVSSPSAKNIREGTLILRVIDRGPYSGRRNIIDVSEGAARRLDFITEGRVRVRVEVLSKS